MKIKRITSMLLALVMCVSLFANWPVPAFATEETPAEQVIVETTPAPVGDGVLDIPVAEPTPTPETPAEPTPTPETPAEPAPTPETPAEPTPTPETPAEPTPTPETPAEPTPTPETPAEPTPTPVGDGVLDIPVAEPTPTPETPAEPTPTPAVQENEVKTVADEEFEPQAEDPKVGDKIYIKSGSLTYKDHNETSDNREVVYNYETKIVSIITDENGNATWYEFEPTGLLLLFKEYKYVKVENTSVEEPTEKPECSCGSTNGIHTSDCPLYSEMTEEQQQAVAEITEKMESFVDAVEAMPESTDVAEFAAAEQDYAEIHALAEKDSPLPDLEIKQYEDAYVAFAKAMGYAEEDIVTNYPNPAVEAELADDVFEAYIMLEESEEIYAELNSGRTTYSLRSTPSVVDMNTDYAAAKAKLDAILEANPDLLGSAGIATFATDLGNGVQKLDTVAENIKMNLFNYGPLINNDYSGSGYALYPFTHSEGTYGWAVDSTGNLPSASAGGWPMLDKTLAPLGTYKYPYITQNKSNNVIKAGKLDRLFNPEYTGADRIDIATYRANISNNPSSTYNPYSYGSVYLPVSNDDGSGTGLFQKDGDYFVYDSGKNAAWYNPDTQKMEIYNYVVRPAYTTFSTSATNGNFLPFNQGHTQGREDYQAETYEKTYSYTDPTTNETVNKTINTVADPDTVTTKPSGALTAYRLYGNSRLNEVDLWFGLNFEFDFYQPKAGNVGGEPMIFDFHGDDDVFVYIDNVLILDIGGTHGAQTGIINFATGAVTNPSEYGQYGTSETLRNSTIYALMKNALGDAVDDSEFIDSDGDGKLDTFADYTKHNLKFFYLERGGNISYCKLKFNMDPLPTGSISVQKDVTEVSGNISDGNNYTFNISATPKNTQDAITKIAYTKYNITNTANQVKGEVDNNSTFTLKDNEKIVFSLDAGTTVKITEAADSITGTTSWNLNGAVTAGKEITHLIQEGAGEAAFTCTNTRLTNSLEIEKEFAGRDYAPEQTYTMNLKFGKGEDISAYTAYTGPVVKTLADGSTKAVDITDGVITLQKDEKVKVEKVPTGMSYILSEAVIGNIYPYNNPLFGNTEKAFGENYKADIATTVDTPATITVTNSHKFADLTIDKVVNEGVYGQSYRFNVSGGPANVNLDVVVNSNSSITIKDLLVGDYTVTEDTDWSWRYGVDSVKVYAGETDDCTTVMPTIEGMVDGTNGGTINLATNSTVYFNNTRDNSQWLDGNSWAQNLFIGTGKQFGDFAAPTNA